MYNFNTYTYIRNSISSLFYIHYRLNIYIILFIHKLRIKTINNIKYNKQLIIYKWKIKK